MSPEAIARALLDICDDLHPVPAWGEVSFFYNPGRILPRGIYVATIKEKDGANDRASKLDRPGVFRLNFGLRRTTFVDRFGPLPRRPPAGGVVATGHDFATLDELLPHPVYGWMGWVAVLNPSEATFERLQPLVAEAVSLASEKFAKRTRATSGR